MRHWYNMVHHCQLYRQQLQKCHTWLRYLGQYPLTPQSNWGFRYKHMTKPLIDCSPWLLVYSAFLNLELSRRICAMFNMDMFSDQRSSPFVSDLLYSFKLANLGISIPKDCTIILRCLNRAWLGTPVPEELAFFSGRHLSMRGWTNTSCLFQIPDLKPVIGKLIVCSIING